MGGCSMPERKSMHKYLVGKKGRSYHRMLVSSNIYFPPSLVIEFLRFTPLLGFLAKRLQFLDSHGELGCLTKFCPITCEQ